MATSRESSVLEYTLNGKRRGIGLGYYKYVTFAEARERAFEARKLIARDIERLDQTQAAEADAAIAKPESVTFREVADAYLGTQK
jgi:hypothetical protein